MSASPIPAAAAFDGIAARYDAMFTDSVVGRAQREAVWKKAASTFSSGDRLLELNCGTGEDAQFLASLGTRVFAIDASPAMIAAARAKCGNLGAQVSFATLPTEHLDRLVPAERFDGVFSNFAGLNCVADLRAVAGVLARLTRPGARALLNFYSTKCLWEFLWYGLRLDLGKAARRSRPRSTASIHGQTFDVFYFRPSQICEVFAPSFTLRSVQAIGLLVPPSYVEQAASRHPRLLKTAKRLDHTLATLPVLNELGDHVLLEFERTFA